MKTILVTGGAGFVGSHVEDLVGGLRLQSPKDLSGKAARELNQKGLLK